MINRAWTKYLPLFLRGKIEGRGYLQNVVSNAGWQFADNVLRMAVSLVVGIWVARHLGPERYGVLSYAFAFVGLFSSLATLGLDDLIVRDVVREPDCRDRILGSAFALRFVGGALAFVAAAIGVFLVRPGDGVSQLMVLIIAAGTLFQAFGVIEFWFHSQVQARYTVYAKNSAFLLSSLIKVLLILGGAGVVAFAWVGLFEVAAGAAGLIVAYILRTGSLRSWGASIKTARSLLKDGWPLMLSGMVIMVYLRIDQVMLGQMAGNEAVGIYSVAVRLAEVWYFIPSLIYWSLFPSIVEARQQSEELFYQRLQKFYNLMALCAYAIALPVALAAQWLVPLLFGEEYRGGGVILAVLIWSNIFTTLEMARGAFLTAMNWTRVYLATVVLGCLLNIGLNLWLIPLYGGLGAAIASVLSYWLAAHGSCFIFKPLRRTGIMLSRALLCPKPW